MAALTRTSNRELVDLIERTELSRVSRPSLNFDAIPAELKALPQWVLWKYGAPRSGGKRAKRPLMPNGKAAKVNEPTTWSPFETVKECFLRGQPWR